MSAALLLPACFGQFLPPPIRNKTGKIRASGYVQLRYTGRAEGDGWYSLRRSKLMLGGDLNQDFEWYVQGFFKEGNHTATDGRGYFQEGWIRFRRWKQAQFTVGRFKPAFGRERFTGDFKLATIDRSVVVRTLILNGEFRGSFTRDLGVQVNGTLRRRYQYAFGVSGGSGVHGHFHGIGPMITTRVTADVVRKRLGLGKPLTIHLGTAFSRRRARNLSFGHHGGALTRAELAHFRGVDRRYGLEAAADWGDWSLRAEYIRVDYDFSDPAVRDFPADGSYVQLARFLAPKWQVVAKLEQFDPNRRIVNDKDLRWLTLGTNYYLHGNRLKVMADYVFRWERVDSRPNNAGLIQFQWFFL